MNTKSYKITELVVSRHNVRFNVEPPLAVVQALADNIIAINRSGQLIHPMTVQDVDGQGQVVAGKTRLLALQLLVEDGRLPEDATTDCFVVEDDAHAVLVSQSENLQRSTMHPVDEFAGFKKLVAENHSIEAIALAFGQTVRYVEGRLRLANVAPALLEGFRTNNHPNLEQVMALTMTDDHARQLAVWKERQHQSYLCNPKDLRKALAGNDSIDANTDRRMRLVSVDEYVAAGGTVQASLLTEHAYLLNPVLFEQLVMEKLNALAADVQAEGWSWVEVYPNDASVAVSKFGTTNPQRREMTTEERKHLEMLIEASDEAGERYNDAPADSEEEAEWADKHDEADAAVDAYRQQFLSFTAEQKSCAGAAVFLDSDGDLEVRRGLVRREDRQALDEAARQGRVAAGVTGGRTTGDAGRPAEAMSAALKDDLLGLRIVAVQNTMAKNPRVAKITLALWAVEQLQQVGYHELPIDLTVSGHGGLRSRLFQLGPVVKEARDAQSDEFAAVVEHLSDLRDKVECWDALAGMTDEQLDSIIAVAVATAINPGQLHEGVTARMLDALNFDMADHFTATRENYTSRVPKKLVLEALADVDKAKDADVLATMKKDGLADVAAHRLAGTGWVPELIRTPGRQPKAEEQAGAPEPKSGGKAGKAPAKKAAKKAPAKKAAKPAAKK